jgi:mono/diheme cytochrome c family protein
MARFRSLAAVAGSALTLTACGASEPQHPGKSPSGAAVFAQAGCGSCHRLGAARARGRAGPDLDSLKPDATRVVRQVTTGGPGMPSFRDRLTADQIEAVATFVATATRTATGGSSVAARFQPDATVVRDCRPQDFSCFEQAFANLAYRRGPKAALAVFDERIRSPGPIESDCHRIAHAIGSGSLSHFRGNVGLALVHGRASCAAGYYHGVLERAFLGIPRNLLAARAGALCGDRRILRLQFILYQCIHGLGHGLMIYTGYDLPLSLRVCDRLGTAWDRRACSGGVFMENLATSYGVRSTWLKDDDLLYPCDAVAERHKRYCYLLATSRILPAVHYDWRKAAAICRRSERGWARFCFHSLGRDASGFTRLNAGRILRICSLAGNMAHECVAGAARDMTFTDTGPRRARVLCTSAGRGVRAYCWEAIGSILGLLHGSDQQRRAACRRATTSYLGACVRGTGLLLRAR